MVYRYTMLRNTHHGSLCPYCERTMTSRDTRLMPTRDHVIPASRGGRAKIICCQTCNGIKADMMPLAWDAFMAANPAWWTLTKYDLRRIRRAALGLPALRRARRLGYVRQGTAPVLVVVPPELIF